MKDILFYIIKNILDDPQNITIEEEKSEGLTNFIIKVPKEEIGKVIGKEGKIIRAIRNVAKIPGAKKGERINITLSEA